MPRFTRRARPKFGRFRARKSVPRWTASTGSLLVAPGALTTSTLFSGADAGLSSLVEGECTVIRMVGQLSAIPAGANGTSVGIGILKLSSALAPAFGGFGDPLVAQQLIERDWMRVMSLDFNANSLANAIRDHREIDIRVKRRLKEDESIRLVVSNAAGGSDITITIDVRILIVIRA